MRHVNIPIFIPHLGCPNQCIFCNQRHISGTVEFDASSVKQTIEETLSTVKDDDTCEIAFFGGSFTGIDRCLMIKLLDIAQEYVDNGRVVGIRMSTRPDYISKDIVDILKNYSITFVELGIQSMNDGVLTYLKRGHTTSDTVKATQLLNENGFKFVGQMMVGLPSATQEDEVYCAEQICSLGASAVRIYPTLVLRHTELEELTYSKEYIPLSLDEAVERSANVLRVFVKNNVQCIRIGLCDSENLHSDNTFVAGPNSPSIGEMVKSELYFQLLVEKLGNNSYVRSTLFVECPVSATSQFIGHKQKNITKLKKQYGFTMIKVKENPNLEIYDLKFEIKEENS